ncbi:hypothetical protein VNO78_12624 [Psophocarpus tetragonolobus]|uniref:Uncharacterized protein n=1 Tax=Psophocarpus tetragonolobus TaxID=3891 RepID=A0AAN9SNA3_PSOTE
MRSLPLISIHFPLGLIVVFILHRRLKSRGVQGFIGNLSSLRQSADMAFGFPFSGFEVRFHVSFFSIMSYSSRSFDISSSSPMVRGDTSDSTKTTSFRAGRNVGSATFQRCPILLLRCKVSDPLHQDPFLTRRLLL